MAHYSDVGEPSTAIHISRMIQGTPCTSKCSRCTSLEVRPNKQCSPTASTPPRSTAIQRRVLVKVNLLEDNPQCSRPEGGCRRHSPALDPNKRVAKASEAPKSRALSFALDEAWRRRGDDLGISRRVASGSAYRSRLRHRAARAAGTTCAERRKESCGRQARPRFAGTDRTLLQSSPMTEGSGCDTSLR